MNQLRASTPKNHVRVHRSRRPKAPRRLVQRGWLPDQHGAIFMTVLPWLLGVLLGGLRGAHWLLLLAWTGGFLTFEVATKWLKARRRDRYRTALVTYLALTTVTGLGLLWVQPNLTEWAAIFSPLLVGAFVLAYRGAERSLLARTLAVVAAGLGAAVAFDLADASTRSLQGWWPWWSAVDAPASWLKLWLLAGLLTAYFWLSVPYVKTLFRARTSRAWLVFSIGAHLLAALVVTVFAAWSVGSAQTVGARHLVPIPVPWWTALAWWLLAARAAVMPLVARWRERPWPAKVVGIGEIVAACATFATLPW